MKLWPRAAPAALAHWTREFVLIVLGVLVALWVSDLNQARQDRKRERIALEQLLATTRDNQERVQQAIEADSGALADSRKLMRAIATTTPLPPSDSLYRWRQGAFRFSVFFPMIGTYTALAQTGDLRLIRDDELRARVATYAGVIEGTASELDNWTETFHRNVVELIGGVPGDRIRDLALELQPPDAAWRFESLQRALYLQTIISANRVSDLRVLQAATRELRQDLEKELKRGR